VKEKKIFRHLHISLLKILFVILWHDISFARAKYIIIIYLGSEKEEKHLKGDRNMNDEI